MLKDFLEQAKQEHIEKIHKLQDQLPGLQNDLDSLKAVLAGYLEEQSTVNLETAWLNQIYHETLQYEISRYETEIADYEESLATVLSRIENARSNLDDIEHELELNG